MAVLLSASMGCAMTVLDTNIVAIVLPRVAQDLGASFADVEWMISSYVLSFAALLLPAGAIADRFGRKKVFLSGIAVFAFASILCGVATDVTALYLSRAIQGAGAAFLLAPALAIIGHSFHGEAERARAWSIWGGIMGLTMVVSPILGGVLASLLGWRWAFYVNLPICLLLAAAVVRLIDESRDAEARRLDPLGIVTFAGAMFGLTSGLIEGQAHGWTAIAAMRGFAGGLFSASLFLLVESRQIRPMLDLTLFRLPRFVGAVLAMFAYAASAQVMASLLPLYLQNGMGRAPLAAGFAMLPFAGAMLFLPQVGRRLGRRFASHQILTLGLAVVSAGNGLTAWAVSRDQRPLVILGMILLGSGGGLLNGETQKAIMSSVPRNRAGMASGLSTTARFSGILLGFALLSAVLAIVARSTLIGEFCGAFLDHCSAAPAFAASVIAGDGSKAVAVMPPDLEALARETAQRGYAAGFSAALFAAALIAGASAALVAVLMRPSPRRTTDHAGGGERDRIGEPEAAAHPVTLPGSDYDGR